MPTKNKNKEAEVQGAESVVEAELQPISGALASHIEHSRPRRLYTHLGLSEGATYDVIDSNGDTVGCLSVTGSSTVDIRKMGHREASDAGHVSLQAFMNSWFRMVSSEDYSKFVKESGGVHPTRVTAEFKGWIQTRPEEELIANVYEVDFVRKKVVNVGG